MMRIEVNDGRITMRDRSGSVLIHSDMTEAEIAMAEAQALASLMADLDIRAPTPPISEKALEYRLVDLMTEAAADPEVMSAIIKVITFLKTKNAGNQPS